MLGCNVKFAAPSEGQRSSKKENEAIKISVMSKKNMFFPAEIPAVAVIEEHSVQPQQLPG